MSENMTDKQMEVILNLVADKFSNCKNMEEVAKAVQEVRNSRFAIRCHCMSR